MADEEMWSVRDLNAKTAPRTHDIDETTRYTLEASKGTAMPRAHAMIFLRDPSFAVFDASGRRVTPLPKQEQAGTREVALDADQCIALYEELTDEALAKRVALRPGGHDLVDAPRLEQVAFLTTAPRKVDLPRAERARDVGSPEVDDPDSVADTAVAKMLEGSMSSADDLLSGRA